MSRKRKKETHEVTSNVAGGMTAGFGFFLGFLLCPPAWPVAAVVAIGGGLVTRALTRHDIKKELDVVSEGACDSLASIWKNTKRPGETGCTVSFSSVLPSSEPFLATRSYRYDDDDEDDDPRIARAIRRNPYLRPDTVRLAFKHGWEDTLD